MTSCRFVLFIAGLAAFGADRPQMPKVTRPVMFNTPEADEILAALQVFPPDNPWNEDISELPLHPNSEQMIAGIVPHAFVDQLSLTET